MNVQLVQKRIPVLGHRGREDDHLVQLSHAFHELIDPGSLDHVDVVQLPFDLDRDGEVGTFEDLFFR